MSSPPAEAEAPPSQLVQDTVRRGTQITVAKKQNWAKLPSLSWDPPSSEGPHSPAPRVQAWENSSGKAHVSQQAWSQKTLVEDGLESRHFERELGICGTSCQTYNAGHPELTRSVGACVSSSAVKVSGQGAYLQSLERSSRAWVLSSSKAHMVEEVSFSLPSRLTEWRRGVDGESNIWYNPIPEEEDLRGFGGGADRVDYGDPWKRRDTEASWENQRDVQAGDCGLPAERRGSTGTQGSPGNPPAKDIAGETASAGRREIPGTVPQLGTMKS